jgi:hypothetical protein
MRTHAQFARLMVVVFFCALSACSAFAQVDIELDATKRLYPEVGAGVRAVRVGPGGRTYVLLSRSVLVFDSAGAKVAEVPAPGTKSPAAIVYGEALDVDTAGNVYVADRGSNSLRVYSPAGALKLNIPYATPTGIVALTGGEFAATSATNGRLIAVFDAEGKELRSFGETIDIAVDAAFNRALNIGRMVGDNAGGIYYAFNFIPEPTFRKYDRMGFSALEVALTLPAFAPPAQAARREIKRQQDRGETPHLKPSLGAIGVDAETQRVWLAITNEVLLFAADGQLLVTYRLYTADGVRIEPNSIQVERDRIVMSSDTLGVFEFPRPDKSIKSPEAAKGQL